MHPGAADRCRGRAAPVEPTVAVHAPVSDEAPPAAFTQSEPLPPEPRTPTSERRRLIATAVGVGVVALFLGWAVGRSGGDSSAIEGGDDSTPPTATTGPPTSAVETAPAVAPSDLPATTRAPRVTTTTVAGWQPAEPIEVSPRIAAMGLDLLVADASGNLTEVATASGEASTIGLRLTTDPGSPLIAGIDWTLVASPNTAQTYLLRGHSQPDASTSATRGSCGGSLEAIGSGRCRPTSRATR